ncbi:g2934 [Coccomyxa viridis]|uniref:G2934 protein n=1 Tax=Coccomyxa viridis TaxID=1274662 RepID=A0ABP1FLK7_9CHLO
MASLAECGARLHSIACADRCRSHQHASCSSSTQPRRRRARSVRAQAAADEKKGGPLQAIKGLARQIQGALPVVGLLSRLSSPSGGIGSDILRYPEFCRKLLYEEASPEFLEATNEWEKAYGKVGQRKFVLLFLFMATQGGGVVSGKLVMAAARRLRVTQDIEIEIERFENALTAVNEQYKMTEKPKGKLKDKINIAVDSIIQMTLGLREGEEASPAQTYMLPPIVASAFGGTPEVQEMTRFSINSRGSRKDAYKV